MSRRDQLIETSLQLFMAHGIRAVGIDRIIAESGVAKKTLYNHFASKEELIVAALKKRDEDFVAKMRIAISRLGPRQQGDPRMARILAFFDGLDEWFRGDSFNGCTFINASAEYPDENCRIHQVCEEHKALVRDTLEGLLTDLALEDARMVARQIVIIADGAIVNAHTAGDISAAGYAKLAVKRLLESYL